ncbi:MAG: hypothetical protein NT005_02045, partial [Spirochaetes bacterium]|nr:hypothetical protein [Spirochaetota bacterium]
LEAPAVEEQLIEVQEAVHEAPVEVGPDFAIRLSSPLNGGYYRTRILIEGRAAGPSMVATSISYQVEGAAGLTGKIACDTAGAFRLELAAGGLTGDRRLQITADGPDGLAASVSLLLRDGNLKPAVVLASPSDSESYGSRLLLAGSIGDPYSGAAAMAGIESLRYEIVPLDISSRSTPLSGTIAVGADGAFRHVVVTKELAGPQQLTLTASGRSSNWTEKTLRLLQGESGIPSFTVQAGDGRATLRWDSLPVADARSAVRYTLRCAVRDPGPGGTTAREIDKIQSPYVLEGLENGSLYALTLTAAQEGEADSLSAEKLVIPLARETLAPVVTGEYRQIRVAWRAIPGAEAFEVWRAADAEGPWSRVAGELAGTAFLDSSAEYGKRYLYAVKPARYSDTMSAAAGGKTLDFPESTLAQSGLAPLPGARKVFVSGGYAYVARAERGVGIVDVSDPRNPAVVGGIALADARDIVVRGRYAYVADAEKGLAVLDVGDPRAPELIGSRYTSDARGVALLGNVAYIADGAMGIKAIDVSNPRNPSRIASLAGANARGLAVAGSTLYVADGDEGLRAYDLADPRDPSPVGAFQWRGGPARGLAVLGDRILLLQEHGVAVIDVVDRARPAAAGTIGGPGASAVAADGGYALVVDGDSRVGVYDLSDPRGPVQLDLLAVEGDGASGAPGIAVHADHAYVASEAGLQVLDVLVTGRSFAVGSCRTPGRTFGVAVAEGRAYVAGHAAGLRVIDVSDPSRLSDASLTAAVATRFAQSVALEAGLAFIADGDAGVRIVDVSGVNPREIGAYRIGAAVGRVAVREGTLFAACGAGGLRIVDASDPANPREVGSFAVPDAKDAAVQGPLLFLAAGEGGVQVLDVSDPTRPEAVGSPIPVNARRIVLHGSIALAIGREGVAVLDITTPRAPTLLGWYRTGWAEDIALDGRLACVAEGPRGLTVLDLSDPRRPRVVSACPEVYAAGVALDGSYALVADSTGLTAVRLLIPKWLMRDASSAPSR